MATESDTTPSAPGKGGENGTADPSIPPASPASVWTDEKVNLLAGQKHREGAERERRAILQAAGVSTVDELVERLKLVPPENKPTKEEKLADKVRAEKEAELKQRDEQIAVLKAKADAAIIKAAVTEHLADTNNPQTALYHILGATNARLAVQEDGTVLPVDGEGNPVSGDLAAWLKAEKAKHSWLLQPMHATSGSAPTQRPSKSKAEQEAEDAKERERLKDPTYRRAALAKKLEESLNGAS